MKKRFMGFEITEKEIDSALRYLRHEKGEKDATRDDAVTLLEDFNALAHMMAHKVLEDEKNGKIKLMKLEEHSKKKK